MNGEWSEQSRDVTFNMTCKAAIARNHSWGGEIGAYLDSAVL